MKIKYLLLLTGLFFFSNAALAQWEFGIQASHIKSWSNSYYFSEGNKPSKLDGIGVSLQFYRSIGKHFQIGIEPGFAQRGNRDGYLSFTFIDFIDPTASSISPIFEHSYYVCSNNIVLPIMAKFNAYLPSGKIGVYIKGGIGPSYMVSAYAQGPDAYSRNNPEGIFSRVDDNGEVGLNRWDLGLSTGAGLEVKAGPGSVLLGADTYTGFNVLGSYNSTKSRSFGLSTGYLIELK